MSIIDDIYVQIGERIRQARDEQGWSQAKLAEALGFGQATVAQYELGRRHIKLDDLYKIAAALNKPYAYFLGLDKQVQEEARTSLERQMRRDIADFVGVRILPVLHQVVSIESPLTEDLVSLMMPVPREFSSGGDCIFQAPAPIAGTPVMSGDYIFLSRSLERRPGAVYLADTGSGLAFVVEVGPSRYSSAPGQQVINDSLVILGEFLGLFTQTWNAPSPGVVKSPLPLAWTDFNAKEQDELHRFAEFLLSKRDR